MSILSGLVEARDVDGLRRYMKEKNLHVVDGKIVPATAALKAEYAEQGAFWDQRQLSR